MSDALAFRPDAETVVVTDGDERAALAIVRSLGRAGYRVVVCSRRGRSLAGSSRYAAVDRAVPDPLADPESYAGAVARVAERHAARLLLPVSDASLTALLPRRRRLGDVVIPFPEYDTYAALSDKARVLDEAAALGIPVPRQVVVAEPGSAGEVARWVAPTDAVPGARDDAGGTGESVRGVARVVARNGAPRFPVVVKPARSVVPGGRGNVKVTVAYATDAPSLEACLRALPPGAFPVLVQERVTGPGVGVFLFIREGDVVAAFAHERVREKPPSGGVSVNRRSIPADPSLVERSRALLAAFGWRGVAMVEFKRDVATGEAYLMEVNARFWGSLQLAVDAGVDFPRLLMDDALGRPAAPPGPYRAGVVTRWTLGEVDHVLARLRGHAPPATNGGGPPGRLRALIDFAAAFGPGARDEVLRRDDPRPALFELMEWLRG